MRGIRGRCGTIALLAAACAVGYPPAVRAAGDWADFHGAGSTAGSSPTGERANVTTALSPPLFFKWSYIFPWAGSPEIQDSSPTVANGLVFLGTTHRGVYAWNLATGIPVWSYATSFAIRSSPAVAGGVLYVGSGGGAATVHALAETTGAFLWSASVPGYSVLPSSASVAGGLIYFGVQGTPTPGALAAFNAATQSLQWTLPLPGAVLTSPAVSGGVVYVTATDGKLYSVSTSGTFQWSYATGAATILSSPVVSGGVVFFGGGNGTFYAIDGASPSLRFSYTVPSATFYGSPAVWGPNVYCAASLAPAATPTAGVLYGWDQGTGALVSGFPVSLVSANATPGNNAADGSVASANGVVYARGENNSVRGFSATNGAPLWSAVAGFPTVAPLGLDLCSVSVGGDRLLASSPRSNGLFVWGDNESPTPTVTPGPSQTATSTATTSDSGTRTATATESSSPTPSASGSSTQSGTSSRTPTASATVSTTLSASFTASRSATLTPSGSPTESRTATATPSSSATSTESGSPTATATVSGTGSPTGSPTATHSTTLSGSPTATGTESASATVTATRTASGTPANSATSSASSTASHTAPPMATSTSGPAGSATSTPTAAPTARMVYAFPDPFDPSRGDLLIRFPPSDEVGVEVYNVSAEWVVTLPNDRIDAGAGLARWNGNDATARPASSGVYYIAVRSTAGRLVTTVVLLR